MTTPPATALPRRLFAVLALVLATAPAAARDIGWLELMPRDELQALEAMDDISHSGAGPAMNFTSERTVAEMAGVQGTMAGYIVPLNVDAQNRMIDMFLVPYFGACIHVPPPPPNQLVYIKPETPQPMGDIWDAYEVTGTLRIERAANEVGVAAYTMDLESLEVID
ncbi:DUF3299 domain-containing protein [Coralloluteibacterium stylophorae]|uniref:DUF3299 domain-containing protein n=1 Tax=Coralloluteibacterium stylophorae TaxID=1776034 RepID=A0A8J7VSB1_9GAMM|nr:DUF3299 domain-containing protein [Coralloluteibacterium stylophorae]MBS7458835.1 DUF3299 domain-containing protein [Coralloluteibacterium stylophorae]